MTDAHHGHNHKPARNLRKKELFKRKYGMTNSEWAELKKTDPQKVKDIRNKLAVT